MEELRWHGQERAGGLRGEGARRCRWGGRRGSWGAGSGWRAPGGGWRGRGCETVGKSPSLSLGVPTVRARESSEPARVIPGRTGTRQRHSFWSQVDSVPRPLGSCFCERGSAAPVKGGEEVVRSEVPSPVPGAQQVMSATPRPAGPRGVSGPGARLGQQAGGHCTAWAGHTDATGSAWSAPLEAGEGPGREVGGGVGGACGRGGGASQWPLPMAPSVRAS